MDSIPGHVDAVLMQQGSNFPSVLCFFLMFYSSLVSSSIFFTSTTTAPSDATRRFGDEDPHSIFFVLFFIFIRVYSRVDTENLEFPHMGWAFWTIDVWQKHMRHYVILSWLAAVYGIKLKSENYLQYAHINLPSLTGRLSFHSFLFPYFHLPISLIPFHSLGLPPPLPRFAT